MFCPEAISTPLTTVMDNLRCCQRKMECVAWKQVPVTKELYFWREQIVLALFLERTDCFSFISLTIEFSRR